MYIHDKAGFKEARERLGLTRGECARLMGLSSRAVVARWERGERGLNVMACRMLEIWYEFPESLERVKFNYI
jgi:DNA-binding transcriptional regulator YiaG